MLCKERHVTSGSEYFFQTPSERVKELLYYITGCGVFSVIPGYHVIRDDYESYLLLYLISGTMIVKSEGKEYKVKSGEVFCLNCHIPHEYLSNEYAQFIYLHFSSKNMLPDYKTICKVNDGIVIRGSVTELIKKNINLILSEFRNSQRTIDRLNSVRIYECICGMMFNFQLEEDSAEIRDIVSKAQNYIKEEIEHDLTLTAVAAQANLSIYHFSRMFKQETGLSPYEYILTERINRAKHLLKTTDLPIKEISYMTGYNSESGFSNSFKNRVGLSPLKFRELSL